MKTLGYGYPRLGQKREYKKIIERFYTGKSDEIQLNQGIDELQKSMIAAYSRTVDLFPVGELTYYDNMFDMAVMIGLYECPTRQDYYDLCRGGKALPMTKWFNTNYHYLVPDFSARPGAGFRLAWNKPGEYLQRYGQGIPWLIGPFTLLKLSRGVPANGFSSLLEEVTAVYRQIADSVPELLIDEPALVLENTPDELAAFRRAYDEIAGSNAKIHLMTYYDSVAYLDVLYDLPVASIGLDFVHGTQFQDVLERGFPADKTLIAGVVDGRNVWRTDLEATAARVRKLQEKAGSMMILSNAGPLSHLPMTMTTEHLDPALMARLAFADERLKELSMLSRMLEGESVETWFVSSDFGRNEEVRKRVEALTDKDYTREMLYRERSERQRSALQLPQFPATTIGSFPQTADIRSLRARIKAHKITEDEYGHAIRSAIDDLVSFQEELGIDVLVHGEFERSDMVEFFAEKLDGIATTDGGWIISYGTRGYRPPILFGDISRPEPMTVKEIAYAQSLTEKPVKGMLTGAVTIISWSFVREDLPLSDVANQISLALQDEIADLELAGIRIVQIDEPAWRERAPIKPAQWPAYFHWAIRSFRLATAAVKPETMIQTHMCYSEFGEIMEQIVAMDFDVILIEGTRSRGTILESFEQIGFDRQIGIGVWDIHSPALPELEDMREITARALKVIDKSQFWINPDCGLKTRGWAETRESLARMMTFCRELRNQSV